MDYNQLVHILASNSPTLVAIFIAGLSNNRELAIIKTPLTDIERRLSGVEIRLDKLDERVRMLELFNAGSAKLLS